MQFSNTKTYNFEGSIRGMRNPMNSWDRSDSDLDRDIVGENDLKLAKKLYNNGDWLTLEEYFGVTSKYQ